MTVRAPADKRFRRAQVKPVRRRGRWRGRALVLLRYGVLITIVAYGSSRAYALINEGNVLRIDQVLVRGNNRMSREEVVAAVNGLRSENILFADLDAWQRKLLGSPWIEDAVLRRVLPSTIEVTVSERRPLGIARLGSALYLVDPAGVIIDEYGPEYLEFDLPIIDGLGSAADDAGFAVDPARAELAARVIEQVGPRRDLMRRLSQLDVADPFDAVAILDGDPALIHVGDDRFLERLLTYLDIAPVLRQRVPAVDYVDMRFGERVYVRPVGGAIRRTTVRRVATPPGPSE